MVLPGLSGPQHYRRDTQQLGDLYHIDGSKLQPVLHRFFWWMTILKFIPVAKNMMLIYRTREDFYCFYIYQINKIYTQFTEEIRH